MEVSFHDVLRGFTNLALVRAIFTLDRAFGDEVLLFHDPANDLFRYADIFCPESSMHSAIPIASVAPMEHFRYTSS